MSTNMTADNKLTRLCHVIKRDDFDGYGFNLHAEKGKPGQYIGKVDDDSPAEVAGLKQGDRIIEVNGVNIGNETHKQVVQRIKAIACEVRLLVIDPMAGSVSPSNQVVDDANTSNSNSSIDAHQNQVNSANNNSNHNGLTTNGQNGNGNGNDNAEMTAILNSSSSSSDEKTSLTDTNNKINNSKSTDENDLSKSNTSPSPSPSPSPPPPPSANSVNYSSHANSRTSPEKSTKTSSPTGTSSGGLNLKMTAAELRAKLAAKKKYDPKTDTVDLRKKYEIVQKL